MVEENQPLIPLRWQETVNSESTENDNRIPGDGEVFQTVETPQSSNGSVWYGPCDSPARSSRSPGPTGRNGRRSSGTQQQKYIRAGRVEAKRNLSGP